MCPHGDSQSNITLFAILVCVIIFTLFSSFALLLATVFRNAKAFDQAKESYIKVGELLKAVNSYPLKQTDCGLMLPVKQ